MTKAGLKKGAVRVGHAAVDLDRVRSYLRSGPVSVPVPADLLQPGVLPAQAVWPLVARRNFRRLLRAFAAAEAPTVHTREAHRRIVAVLMALPDTQLDHFLTEPEVTSWLAGLDLGGRWDGAAHLPVLAQAAVANAAAAGIECEALDITHDGGAVTFRPFALALIGDGVANDAGNPVAWCEAGEAHVRWGDRSWVVRRGVEGWHADGVAKRLATTADAAVVTGNPDAWLRASFPVPDESIVSDDPDMAARVAAKIDEGLGLVDAAWPAMAAEVRSLLRWVVPMASGDSFFVPAFRGLVAVPDVRPLALGLIVVHELSHNIMSCLYDLVDVIRNPDHRVNSPFSREREPLASVIHSCWAFSHELRAIRALRAAGRLDDGTDWDRVILKTKIFYDKALPLIRGEGELTSYGVALLEAVETHVYGEQ